MNFENITNFIVTLEQKCSIKYDEVKAEIDALEDSSYNESLYNAINFYAGSLDVCADLRKFLTKNQNLSTLNFESFLDSRLHVYKSAKEAIKSGKTIDPYWDRDYILGAIDTLGEISKASESI